MIEVELAAVQIDQRSATPVMLLKESQPPGRTLAVYIGRTEAQAIVDSIQGIEPPRPMTHDLMRDVIEALGAIVVRVVITELVEATFYAQVELKIQQKVVVSQRGLQTQLHWQYELPLQYLLHRMLWPSRGL